MNPCYQKIEGKYNRTIVIGDIHGCYIELLQLMEKIGPDINDLIITVGDFMDRGPGSWDTAIYIKNSTRFFSVLGNHERRIMGVIHGTSHAAWSQLQSLAKISEDQHNAWALYFGKLPAVIESPQAIITHARLDPARTLQNQDPFHTSGTEKVRIPLDEKGIPFWYHEWQAKYKTVKPICIGHVRYERVLLDDRGLYALDTGAVRGGLLTALILPEKQLISVPVANHYITALDSWNREHPERLKNKIR